MATINLDDARAARLEDGGEPHDVVFRGTTHHVPAEAPWQFVQWIAMDNPPKAIQVASKDLWSDMHATASLKDVTDLVDALINLWGLSNPESESEDPAGE